MIDHNHIGMHIALIRHTYMLDAYGRVAALGPGTRATIKAIQMDDAFRQVATLAVETPAGPVDMLYEIKPATGPPGLPWSFVLVRGEEVR